MMFALSTDCIVSSDAESGAIDLLTPAECLDQLRNAISRDRVPAKLNQQREVRRLEVVGGHRSNDRAPHGDLGRIAQ